jgi:hypothetical protein
MKRFYVGHKRIRVLQINKLYYPWVGGVEKVVQDISEGLKDKVNIEVLACQPKGLGRKKLINGVRERPIRGLISGHIYYISAGSLQVCSRIRWTELVLKVGQSAL